MPASMAIMNRVEVCLLFELFIPGYFLLAVTASENRLTGNIYSDYGAGTDNVSTRNGLPPEYANLTNKNRNRAQYKCGTNTHLDLDQNNQKGRLTSRQTCSCHFGSFSMREKLVGSEETCGVRVKCQSELKKRGRIHFSFSFSFTKTVSGLISVMGEEVGQRDPLN